MNEASDNSSAPPDCGNGIRQLHHWHQIPPGHHMIHPMLVECLLGLNPPMGGSRWVKRPIERCCLCLLEISLLRKPIRRYQRIRQPLWSKPRSLTISCVTDYDWPAARCPHVVGRKMPDTATREATRKRITLLLADDHPAFREGLSRILAKKTTLRLWPRWEMGGRQ